MPIRKILVATDFSEQAAVAVAHARVLANRDRGELILLHVEPDAGPAPTGAAISQSAMDDVQALRHQLAGEARSDLEALAEGFRADGLTVTVEIRVGHPDEAITEAAQELGADLIVTGTHGRTGLARFFLGSVAEKVARMATTNVMVVRPCDEPGRYRRILVPTDFSPASEKALRLAMSLAAENADIDVFHAWQYPPGTHAVSHPDPGGPLAGMRDEIVASGQRQADDLLQRQQATEMTLHFVQDYGPAAQLVQERLDEVTYDLVCMGTHGYRGFRRFILGSVAEATIRHANCSVMIAHAGDLPKPA
jgi:nucleotide-binding universal stress UspA family protein